ncbi:MAG: tRNA pseudouridine(38-40) synthase TruA [Bacteroidales bacterium]|nr:tRNA pseudouridine(38-40) synthase TruA [Bacteroidales bacterium]
MKYFIYLQYDGTNYHGWQTQPDAVTVQETIEQKLSMLLRRQIFIVGAGRTDAGVHASQMVAHFALTENQAEREPEESEELSTVATTEKVADTEVQPEAAPAGAATEAGTSNASTPLELSAEELNTLTFKLNQVLPADIVIKKIIPVRDEAHARFSPISRTYRYYITTHKALYNRDYVMRMFEPLDIEMMNHACAKLFCYEDFTSFSKLHTDTKTNNCKIMEAYWTARPKDGAEGWDYDYVFTIKADRFLRNMVRAIVGTLIQVGRHRMTIQEFAQVIERKDRCTAGDSVPAKGLFLEEIEYPEDIFYNEEQ